MILAAGYKQNYERARLRARDWLRRLLEKSRHEGMGAWTRHWGYRTGKKREWCQSHLGKSIGHGDRLQVEGNVRSEQGSFRMTAAHHVSKELRKETGLGS